MRVGLVGSEMCIRDRCVCVYTRACACFASAPYPNAPITAPLITLKPKRRTTSEHLRTLSAIDFCQHSFTRAPSFNKYCSLDSCRYSHGNGLKRTFCHPYLSVLGKKPLMRGWQGLTHPYSRPQSRLAWRSKVLCGECWHQTLYLL